MQSRVSHGRYRATVALVLMASCIACLAGCARNHVRATGAWPGNAPRDQSFSRVMVVGVSPDVNQRCSFEFFLASQIESESVVAFPSCRVVTKRVPLTLESIEEAVAKYDVDAVLATSLVAAEWDAQDGGSRDTRGTAAYKATGSGWATGYYGVYGVPVVYADFEATPSAITIEGEVRLASRLFETSGKTLIYSLTTVGKDLESRDTGLHDIAAAIADQMRKDRLIR